jgi:hypothetical protein
MYRVALAGLALAGCTFQLDGIPVGGESSDLAGADLAGADLSSVNGDFATPGMPDLAPASIKPSHVPPASLQLQAADLTGVTGINTTDLTLEFNRDGNFAAPPAGVTFAVAGNIAVLSVGGWTVDKDVAVMGDKPLAVIAAGAVDVQAVIHAEASHDAAGPGGELSGMGQGKGGSGTHHPSSDDSGGGGAGFGAAGAQGGTGGQEQGGAPGQPYLSKVTDFAGGSGGGLGSGGGGCGNGMGQGGAGGGAVQISSAVSIHVGAMGGVHAGGGGGRGGCGGAGGGGGGSGGDVFLESRDLTVEGTLAANGGGGGGAGSAGDGSDGTDGQLGLTVAMGGASGGGFGGPGGAGATRTAMPVKPAGNTNGGGGGGGLGRIWLRTGNVPANLNGATLSPMPMSDATL